MKQSAVHRAIIIGDVHGCLDELERLITTVNYTPQTDSLYFLGDIINRGPYSKASFFKVLELGGTSLQGNHEWHIVQQAKRKHPSKQFTKLRQEFGDSFQFFLNEIEQWPLFIETKDFILVHGGLVPGLSPKDTDPRLLTSIRTWDGEGKDLTNPANPPWFDFYDGEKLVVFGHWAALEGIRRPNVIGLDTGCVYGKKLTALVLPAGKLVSVPAERVYRPVQ